MSKTEAVIGGYKMTITRYGEDEIYYIDDKEEYEYRPANLIVKKDGRWTGIIPMSGVTSVIIDET